MGSIDMKMEAEMLGIKHKTYCELYDLIEKHAKMESEIYPNILRMWSTMSGKRIVIKNVYGIMVSLDFCANSAVAECEKRLGNEEY